MTQSRKDISYKREQLVLGREHGRQIKRGLSGVFGSPSDAAEQ